jgi:hypothetical protein
MRHERDTLADDQGNGSSMTVMSSTSAAAQWHLDNDSALESLRLTRQL